MKLAEDLPAIVFTESNDPSAMIPPSCATTVGETHLMTFDGLFYDFQASGDFLLVQADRVDFPVTAAAPQDFVVQTRQVSLAPMWPNVSANEAVATRIGGTRVAVCLPMRLVIEGDPEQLDDGESLSLPSGVSVTRTGNAYIIARQNGDIVRAEVYDRWIDVFVGVAPESQVRGLLGNANGDTGDDIATRDRTVLAQPVSFADLYHRYGDTWRVPFHASLLSDCGDEGIKPGNPQEPFYANNLTPDQYRRARQICTEAGVEDQALLDACTLDVAVLDTETAATVFTRMPTPIAVMQAGSRTVCSRLGNDPRPSLLDQDIFTFAGTAGEQVTITVDQDPTGVHTGERVTLILIDAIKGTILVQIDNSALPNEITTTLPATGTYLIIIGEQPNLAPGERFRGDYCLTLESSGGAAQTLEPTVWVE